MWLFNYHPVDKDWQEHACRAVGLRFKFVAQVAQGGPNVALRRPKSLIRDGNCLFRAFSYLITGDECHHRKVRSEIDFRHMREIEGLLLAIPFVLSNCSSVSEYVNTTGMDKNRTWGTEAEKFVLAHKNEIPIYTAGMRPPEPGAIMALTILTLH